MKPYTIKRSLRSRNIRITVVLDGSIRISAPLFATEKNIEHFVNKKANWILRMQKKFEVMRQKTLFRPNKSEFVVYKKKASELIHQRIQHFNMHYRFNINSIKIKKHRSRWGSCSAKGNLNFNYMIIFLPPELQDYIIVHELCHIRELNHSSRFWKLVEECIPDYKKIIRELRRDYITLK